MKAMILAAGLGTRLYPLTKDMPKCMVSIGGKPLIVHQLDWMRRNGIMDIAINLHHFPEKITSYLGDGSSFGVKITYSHEKEIMGTAGGVKKKENFFDQPFLVFYGDEYTNLDLRVLQSFHEAKGSVLTMLLNEKQPGAHFSNIIRLDQDKRVTAFVEKPNQEEAKRLHIHNLQNCGIYLCDPKVLSYIPKNRFSDFGSDVLPRLVVEAPVYGFELPDQYSWYELGTLEKFNKFKKEIENILPQ